MPAVLLAGAFGQGNPGDEALLEAFLENLRRSLPEWESVATSRDPEGTRAAHGCEAVSSGRRGAVLRAAVRSDALVFAGGTVFKPLHPRAGRAPLYLLRRAAALAGACRLLGRRVAMVGVGAEPLPGPGAEVLARTLVREAHLLILRDEESAGILAAGGAPTPLRIGADPAWVLFRDAPMEPWAPADRDAVVVALSHLAGGPELPGLLADALGPVAAEGLPVLLQPWQVRPPFGRDLALARAVRALLQGRVEICDPPADVRAARAGFRSARLVVALRFHAVEAAAAARVPVLAVAHEAKLAGLARRLGQPLVRSDADPRLLSDAIVRAARNARPARPAEVAQELALAEEGFRLLRLLLAGGDLPEDEEAAGLPLGPDPWAA